MRTLPIFLFSLCLFVFLACSDEEGGSREIQDVEACLGTARTNVFFANCAYINIDEDPLICEVNVGQTFELSESSINLAQNYCDPVGQVYVFEASDGEQVEITLFEKSFENFSIVENTFESCPLDPSRSIALCHGVERISLAFRDMYNQFSFNVIIDVGSFSSNDMTTTFQEKLSVYSEEESTPLGSLESIMVLDDPNHFLYAETYDEIVLNGRSYYNVFETRAGIVGGSSKYFFNAEYGFLGFIDDGSKLFTIQ